MFVGGWSDEARQAALEARRRNAALRKALADREQRQAIRSAKASFKNVPEPLKASFTDRFGASYRERLGAGQARLKSLEATGFRAGAFGQGNSKFAEKARTAFMREQELVRVPPSRGGGLGEFVQRHLQGFSSRHERAALVRGLERGRLARSVAKHVRSTR